MSKLEYTKDDLIDIQNDYDLLYKKLDHYNKIINEQALEIARLKKQLENENKVVQEYLELEKEYEELKEINNSIKEVDRKLLEKIDKSIEFIKENIDNTGWLEIGNVDVKEFLEILGDKE